VEPNEVEAPHGAAVDDPVAVGDLVIRIWRTLSAELPWYWYIAPNLSRRARTSWNVEVCSATTSSVLARRGFGRRRDAIAAKRALIERVSAAHPTDPSALQRMLDALALGISD
jgi:hypothetical protein